MRAFLILLAVSTAAFGQCPTGYSYQRSITVNNGQVAGGTQTNFPMLVLNPTSSLKTTANGGHVQNVNGYDIVFVAPGGSLLNFEMVGHGTAVTTYSPTTGNAEFRVNVASLADGSVIYMCYGNAAITTYQGNDPGAWNAAYKGVWHLNSTGTTLSAADSTGYTNGTITGATGGTGQVSGSGVFSGTLQYIDLGNTAALQSLTGDMTIEAWVKPSDYNNYNGLIAKWQNGTGCAAPFDSYIVAGAEGAAAGKIRFQRGSGSTCNSTQSTGAVPIGTWTYVAITMSGTSVNFYQNGAANGSGSITGTITDTGRHAFIGTREDLGTGTMFKGSMDELKVSNVARSTNWILTVYRNENAPSGFYTLGAETTQGASSFTVSPASIPSGHAGNITLTLSGAGTNWSGATVFTVSGVANVTKVSQTVASGGSATVVVTTGAGTGTLSVAETGTGLAVANTNVITPVLSISPASGNLKSIQTLTLIGANTIWNSETAAGLFTVSGGTGSSIGTATITGDSAGTVSLTVGTAAGPITITDSSTGATAVFMAGGGSGGGTCAVAWSQ